MIFLKNKAAEAILSAMTELYGESPLTKEEIFGLMEIPPDDKMGDLAFPCFRLSKVFHKSPAAIASELVGITRSNYFEKVVAVGAYLNLFLSPDELCRHVVLDTEEKKEKYGAPDLGSGKTVVLDYSSPNVAKPFHIGHLGTTVIGHSLRRLHEFAGYKCVGINYLGDWGTQFGKLITAYRKWGNREKIENGGIDKLVELYVKFHAEAEKDEKLNDEARAEFRKLELGDEENRALWRWFVDLSLAEYQKTYRQLGIEFDSYKGESFYTDKMPAQVEILREKNLLTIDDGASIVDLSAYDMPPCLILKRDGSTLYPTRDIAAAVYRKNTYHFDKAVYVTSAGQCLHFKQWFKVVEMMGYDWYDELVHVPYGTVSINGEKLATRTGNVILLRDLFDAAIDKVREVMKEKNPNLADADKIAEQVGVGAVIFYYLSGNRMKDINFVMEDALNFDGNTGPYVQYTYARTCSLLRKCEKIDRDLPLTVSTDEEKTLCKTLASFEGVVRAALAEYEPSLVTRYILDVCAAFNRFYHNCQILFCEDEAVRMTRIRLTEATKTVLGNAFPLICLAKTEKI